MLTFGAANILFIKAIHIAANIMGFIQKNSDFNQT